MIGNGAKSFQKLCVCAETSIVFRSGRSCASQTISEEGDNEIWQEMKAIAKIHRSTYDT